MPNTKRNLPGFKTSTQPQSMEVQALLTIGNDPLSELFALVDIPLVLSLTCRKLRDAGPKHTKTWLGHVVTSTHLLMAWGAGHGAWARRPAGRRRACLAYVSNLHRRRKTSER